jgi:hypothetical protein
MAIANTPNETREFVCASERQLPEDQRTYFRLRAVPFAVRSHFGVLLGMAPGDDADPMKRLPPDEIAKLYVLALRCSLVGWRNFRDATGAEVPFSPSSVTVNGAVMRGCASDDALEMLDLQTSAELGSECLQSMVLSRNDVLG